MPNTPRQIRLSLECAAAVCLIAHTAGRTQSEVIAAACTVARARAYSAGPRASLEARPARCRLVTYGIPDAAWRALRSLAKAQRRTVGDLCAFCIRQYLADHVQAYRAAHVGDMLADVPGMRDLCVAEAIGEMQALAEAAP
jgi:hypothetical protein